MTTPHADDQLRAWAAGSLPLTGAVELLTRAFDGRFAAADQPWIRIEKSGAAWLDDQFLAASLDALPGGERRVLTVVAALADSTGTRRVDLADIVTGIDRDNLDLVLAALAYAAGSHQDATLAIAADGRSARLVRQPSLHPWPATGTNATASPAPSLGGVPAVEPSGSLGR